MSGPWEQYATKEPDGPWSQYQAASSAPPERSTLDAIKQGAGNLAAGAIRGAGSIGATLLAPVDAAARAVGIQNDYIGRTDRRAAMDGGLQAMGAEPDSAMFKGGKILGEVAGTAGAGGALANGARAVPWLASSAPNLINAIGTSGMSAGAGGGLANLATRAAGGAISGGVSAGMVDPSQAVTGSLIGAALPPVLAGAGKLGAVAGKTIRGGGASPEVAALADRAKQLGIDIPADRIVSSKPLDAIASGLNYVPFSGRAATEAKMGEQLNTAASKLIGQNTPNMTKALRDAGADLGAKFDTTLRGTGVAFDKTLLEDVTRVFNTAEKELGSDALKPIASQVDELIAKGANGVIDGQAAYNIKRTLDRIGRQNTPAAYHALELKGVLMDALNRSLGPTEAAAFAQTRQQYGNMLALEKLAKNGVDGEISVARLANMRNINNEPLQELADIAAQFVKPREGQHGAMQRAVAGGAAAWTAGIPGLIGGAAAGRATNMALNSGAARRAVLGQPINLIGSQPAVQQLGYRAAPVLATDQ